MAFVEVLEEPKYVITLNIVEARGLTAALGGMKSDTHPELDHLYWQLRGIVK